MPLRSHWTIAAGRGAYLLKARAARVTNEQLKAFLAVVEHGSFRKAATHIFKTQAAVSSAIKALEDEYNVRLFNREEYRPKLTAAGQTFFHNAQLTMNHFQRLDKVGRQLAQGNEASFNIVISIAFPLPALLKNIKNVSEQFPSTQFKVFTEALNGVVERIDNDAHLAFGPDIHLNENHEKIAITQVTFINVAAPGYFPQGPDSVVSREDIEGYSQIITRDSAKHIEKASFNTSANRKSWSVNDFQTKKELILAGLGWGSIPKHLISEELKHNLLIPIRVEGIEQQTSGPLYMFRHRDHHHGPVSNQFWNELKKAYEQ
jgi:DNA-binding transcriptional LysR family regulator